MSELESLLGLEDPCPYEMQPMVVKGLAAIGQTLCQRGLTGQWWERPPSCLGTHKPETIWIPGGNPTENSGAVYEGVGFAMRARCWCEGEQHPHGCPPNFELTDQSFCAVWGHELGDGPRTSQTLAPGQWEAVLAACLAEAVARPLQTR